MGCRTSPPSRRSITSSPASRRRPLIWVTESRRLALTSSASGSVAWSSASRPKRGDPGDANSSLNRPSSASTRSWLEQAGKNIGSADKRVKRLQRERDGLKAQLGGLSTRQPTAARRSVRGTPRRRRRRFSALEAEHERLRVEASCHRALQPRPPGDAGCSAALSQERRARRPRAPSRQRPGHLDPDRQQFNAQALVDQAFEQHKALEQAEAEPSSSARAG